MVLCGVSRLAGPSLARGSSVKWMSSASDSMTSSVSVLMLEPWRKEELGVGGGAIKKDPPSCSTIDIEFENDDVADDGSEYPRSEEAPGDMERAALGDTERCVAVPSAGLKYGDEGPP